ncbi:MAG: Fic family protein [Elusimicrobiota bacterium]|nr:Fic family protein [Elusimicrobiota bacterium]
MKKSNIWEPVYKISPKVARALMDIEAAKTIVERTALPPAAVAELRRAARVRSAHFSTRIEGNRLTLKEAQEVIEDKKASFRGLERDTGEVRNYWNALLKVEEWGEKRTEFTEDLIQRLHAIVEKGKRSKPTPYRTGQNVIKDSATGAVVYMPPEAKEVPKLMSEMAAWVRQVERSGMPGPIIAALAHYQFVTIHPYYDGNGRTARLLTTFLLQRDGYGLRGFFSLEEHHARDLQAYYASLAVHKHHNYYGGRAQADLTGWLEYFITLLADVFGGARDEAAKYAKEGIPLEPEPLRKLDRRARAVLGMFAHKDTITAQEVAATLGLSGRMARNILTAWVKDGWLVVANASNRARAYQLSAIYRKFTGNNSKK